MEKRNITKKFPALNVETRWSSTYLMVGIHRYFHLFEIKFVNFIILQLADVLKCRHIITSFKEESTICNLLFNKWHAIEQLHRVLKPLYQATIVMQRSDFTMTDFYASWTQVEKVLNKYVRKGNCVELATLLLQNMEKRKHRLLDNPAMMCSILLDPRFCCEMEGERKVLAIDTALNIWRKLKQLHSKLPDGSIQIVDSDTSDDDEISIQSTTLLKKYISKQKQNQNVDQRQLNIYSASVFQITEDIESFIQQEHEIPDGGIYDFWRQKKIQFPRLFELAQIVYAISPTQAIVERAFSALSHVFSSKRNQLGEQLLDDILMISLNQDLFAMVNNEDTDQVIEKYENSSQ